jgi:hypothetical protein
VQPVPAVIDFFCLAEPKAVHDDEPRQRRELEGEHAPLDAHDDRIAVAIVNWGPDAIELFVDGDPIGSIEPGTHNLLPAGGGALTATCTQPA